MAALYAGKGTVWGSVANLAATAMGAGILSLPISFYYCGWLLGTVMLLLFAVCSDISLVLLVRAAKMSNCWGFEQLAIRFYGNAGRTGVAITLVLLLFGAAVIILIVIGDLISHHVHQWEGCAAPGTSCPWYLEYNFLALYGLLLVLPLCCLDNLSALRFTSTGAVFSIVFVSCCVIATCAEQKAPGSVLMSVPHTSMQWSQLALAFPIQSLAFCCQFNVIELYQELRPDCQPSINRIIHLSTTFCFIFYTVFGLAGYIAIGEDTLKYPNILLAFHQQHNPLLAVGSISVALTNMFKLPLIVLPLRTVLNSLLGFKPNCGIRIAETVFIAGVVYAITVTARNLALVFQILGITAGVWVCFILPGAFYYKATQDSPPTSPLLGAGESIQDPLFRQFSSDSSASPLSGPVQEDVGTIPTCKTMSISLVGFGMFVGLVSLSALIFEAVYAKARD
jgi:amino acid permease